MSKMPTELSPLDLSPLAADMLDVAVTLTSELAAGPTVFDIAADLDERGWSWRDMEDAANELIGQGAVEVEMPSRRWAVTEVGLALLDRAGSDR